MTSEQPEARGETGVDRSLKNVGGPVGMGPAFVIIFLAIIAVAVTAPYRWLKRWLNRD